MTDDIIVSTLKECDAVRFGEFVLASGQKSNFYIDIKKASTNPKALKIIAEKIAGIVREYAARNPGKKLIIGGVELGGVPIATAVSLETGLPLLIIRKAVKDYGTKSRYVGDMDPEAEIIMTEDVTTSGGSVKKAIEAIRADNGCVNQVIVIVDRESGATESLKEIGIDLIPLVRSGMLLKKNDTAEKDPVQKQRRSAETGRQGRKLCK